MGKNLYFSYNITSNRVSKSVVGGIDRFYFYDKNGRAKAGCLLPYSSDLTYNILGNGGDNIGQVRVRKGVVSVGYYYLKDHLGSVRMIVDASGNVVGYDDYYPYGMTMSSLDKGIKFISI